MTRWTFGVEPLGQTKTAARLLRSLAGRLVALENDDADVEQLIADLHAADERLAARMPADLAPRVGPGAFSEARVYLDHSRDIGAFNPCFPEYEITVSGDHASGTVSFPLAFEGPPGVVHGGFLAVFFDCVIQHHNCDVGVAGKTTALEVRFRRPTPILTDLEFDVTRSVVDGRINSTARLLHEGAACSEAEVRAVAGDRSALPDVSPRRPGEVER